MANKRLCERCLGLPIRPHELAQAITKMFNFLSWPPWFEIIRRIKSLGPDECAFCSLLNQSLCQNGRTDTAFRLIVSGERLLRNDGTVLLQPLLRFRSGNDPKPEWLSLLLTHDTRNPEPVRSSEPVVRNRARPINPSKVDWGVVRSWMCDCDATHPACTVQDPDEQSIPGFQVIDCKTCDIIPLPPHCTYAALSYVWGLSGCTIDHSHQRLKDQAPQTIKDAMLCTQALGLQYLWVDRYCIDQTDPRTKHRLIQRMDQIYRNASITIISAAGEGPDCGLPGVSERPRREQEFFEIHGVKYFTLPCPKLEVRKSSWNNRGWTYQEGLLSRRRVVFTQHQVYFQCLGAYGCEAISGIFKPRGMDSSSMQVFPVHVDRGRAGRLGRWQSFWILPRLNEYLGRSLSHDSDILNAFMGILRQAWLLLEPIYHFWGLPFISGTKGSEALDTDVLESLMWSTQRLLRRQLVPSRRDKFPSWTWAGWQNLGKIANRGRGYRVEGGITFKDVANNRLDLKEYIFRMSSSWDVLAFKPVLYVTGWFAAIHVGFSSSENEICVAAFTREADGVEETYDNFKFAYVDFIDGGAHLTSLTQGESHPHSIKWPAIMFTPTENMDRPYHSYGLLLKEIRDGEFEKVGVFEFLVDDLPPSDQSQVNRREPHEASEFAVRSCVRRWPGKLVGTLGAEWRTIKLV